MRWLAGTVVVLVLAGCAPVMKAPAGLEQVLAVGAIVPDRSVPMTDGTRVSLRGSNTVLLFYRGQW